MRNFPKSLGIHLSPDCALRCPGCYLRKDVTKGDITRLGDLLRDFSMDRQVWVAINSGHVNPVKDLRSLNLGLHGLTTTLDVITPIRYDLPKFFRQINVSYDAFKRTILPLSSYHPPLNILRHEHPTIGLGLSVLCYPSTDQDLIAEEITALTKEHGMEVYLLVEKGNTQARAAASVKALVDLQGKLYRRGIYPKVDNCLTLLSNCEACEAGSSTIDVEVNGDVSSCSFLNPLGNLFEDPSVLERAVLPAGPCGSMEPFEITEEELLAEI